MVSVASRVCKVEKTKWPVSAASSAVEIVSRSRISPTRMTSGSWRKAARKAVENVAVQERDGVLDGDEVIGAIGIDAVDHGGERGGLAGTGGSGDENEAALLFANAVDDRGKIELVGGANFRGNDAQHHANVAALLENVDAKAAEAGDAVSHVQLGGLLKLLLLAVGHHAEGHGEHFFGGNAGDVGDGV